MNVCRLLLSKGNARSKDAVAYRSLCKVTHSVKDAGSMVTILPLRAQVQGHGRMSWFESVGLTIKTDKG